MKASLLSVIKKSSLTRAENYLQEFINVDFEFFDPKPTDYHGVKALLKSYLDDEEFDLPGLVDLVLAQTTVGSVIKTTEDDNPIGLLTVLGLERYKVRLR